MQESHVEGVANHDVPESCVYAREGVGEALTGVRTGRVLSREIKHYGTPTRLSDAEGEMCEHDSASARAVLRGRRPRARTEPSCARTARSS